MTKRIEAPCWTALDHYQKSFGLPDLIGLCSLSCLLIVSSRSTWTIGSGSAPKLAYVVLMLAAKAKRVPSDRAEVREIPDCCMVRSPFVPVLGWEKMVNE